MENRFFFILKVTEDFGTDPHPDPLDRGMDPKIRIRNRIRTKMSRIQNTGRTEVSHLLLSMGSSDPRFLFPTTSFGM